MEFWKALFEFLEKRLPWLLAGYRMGQTEQIELKKQIVNLELDLKSRKNAEEINLRNSNLADGDLKSEVLSYRRRKPNTNKSAD